MMPTFAVAMSASYACISINETFVALKGVGVYTNENATALPAARAQVLKTQGDSDSSPPLACPDSA
jgi:hypothetical protein